MNDKITLPDLIDLLAAQSGTTKKESETFLKEFFALASDVITSGEPLKISGLGTFKPLWVEARASVNVQTGQPFEIPGHYKLSFTPDKSLREAVNSAFSAFGVEVLDDDVDITALQSDLPPVEPEESEEELPVKQEEKTSECVVPENRSEGDSAVEEKQTESESEVAVLPDEKDERQPDAGNMPENKGCELSEEYQTCICTNRRARWKGYISGFLSASCIMLLIGFGVVSYLWYNHPVRKPKPVAEKIADRVNQPQEPAVVMDVEERQENPETIPSGAQPAIADSKPDPVVETMRQGVYLTTLALRHYGDKAFWVYIYQENRQNIPNPNRVRIGTKIVIPPAEKYGIDARSPECVAKAVALGDEILGKKK